MMTKVHMRRSNMTMLMRRNLRTPAGVGKEERRRRLKILSDRKEERLKATASDRRAFGTHESADGGGYRKQIAVFEG